MPFTDSYAFVSLWWAGLALVGASAAVSLAAVLVSLFRGIARRSLGWLWADGGD